MSDLLWNETNLLERYHVFNYNYFIDIRSIFLKHLESLYILYRKNLKSEFISLPFCQEAPNVEKEIQSIKTDLFESRFFRKQISQMNQIVFQHYQEDPFEVPFFVLEENRRLHKIIQIHKYTKVFEKVSSYVFRYFLKTSFSITTLDAMIRSLKLENSLHLFALPCLVSAFFQFVLYRQSSQ